MSENLCPTLNKSERSRLITGMSHDWIPVLVTRHGRKRGGFHCRNCHLRALCPHGCGLLQWVEDEWYCPKCGDEWHDAETFEFCKEAR